MIVLYILLAIVILLVMVVIHEFGHYVAGKLLKFKINEFSVGFGPKIFSKKKKNGEVFSLRLIPLGGFCAFEGETESDADKLLAPEATSDGSAASEGTSVSSETPAKENRVQESGAAEKVNAPTENSENANTTEKPRAFVDEKPWKRIIVLLAGGVFNLLSALIFSIFFIAIVGYATPTVVERYAIPDTENSYYCEELREGDEIIAVNGKKISVMNSFQDYTSKLKAGDTVVLTVIRDGKKLDVTLLCQSIKTSEDAEPYTGFGFMSENRYGNDNFGKRLGDAFVYCVPFTAKLSWTILGSFFQLFTGKVPITDISGPIGTVGMMAQITQMDWRNVFILLPLIASNLGLFNLLPIPALDGSKVVFTIIEWIRKKPINRKVEGYIHTIGIIVLMALVVIVDIVNLILRFV